MSQKQVFTCDECGAQKKETNHMLKYGLVNESMSGNRKGSRSDA